MSKYNVDIKKIETFINAYGTVLRLDNDTKNLLVDLMVNIVSRYGERIKGISKNSDPQSLYLINPVDGYYSMEDFFLNRLIRNVVRFDKKRLDDFGRSKGEYHDSTVSIDEEAINESIDYVSRIIKENGYSYNGDLSKNIYRKVVMHEFEHGLKSQHNNVVEPIENVEIMKQVSYLIGQTEYASIIKKPEELDSINRQLPEGRKYVHDGWEYKNSNIKYLPYLDELNNERESVVMAECPVQSQAGYAGFGYNVKNFESSSCIYSSTLSLFESVIGLDDSFKGAYLNPEVVISSFNERFNGVFQKIYNSDESAMNILCNNLEAISRSLSVTKMINADKLKLEAALLLSFYSTFDERFSKDPMEAISAWKNIKENALVMDDNVKQQLLDNPGVDLVIKNYIKIYSNLESHVLENMKLNDMAIEDTSFGTR